MPEVAGSSPVAPAPQWPPLRRGFVFLGRFGRGLSSLRSSARTRPVLNWREATPRSRDGRSATCARSGGPGIRRRRASSYTVDTGIRMRSATSPAVMTSSRVSGSTRSAIAPRRSGVRVPLAPSEWRAKRALLGPSDAFAGHRRRVVNFSSTDAAAVPLSPCRSSRSDRRRPRQACAPLRARSPLSANPAPQTPAERRQTSSG